MVCGGVCQTPTYLSGKGKEACQREFEKQIEIFLKNDVDFLLAEVNLTFKGIFKRIMTVDSSIRNGSQVEQLIH